MHDDETLRRFEAQRGRLRAIAVRVLGADADADDVVQEAWLRWSRAPRADVENVEAWFTTVVSRLALDRLRSPDHVRRRDWRPERWEPVSTEADPAELVEQDDRVAVALLVVLDRLSAAERLAFVLHDVFGLSFDEIAQVLDRSPQATRQLASRARRRVREAPDPARDRARERSVVQAWLRAVEDGDLRALLDVLDEDAVLSADYGSTSEVLRGASAIVARALQAARLAAHSVPIRLGGRPGVAAIVDGGVVSLVAFEIVAGRITGLDVLADPQALASLPVIAAVTERPPSGE